MSGYVVLYAETKLFLDMLKIYQRIRAYRIYVTHTLTIGTAYAGYARHTLITHKVHYAYACYNLHMQYIHDSVTAPLVMHTLQGQFFKTSWFILVA